MQDAVTNPHVEKLRQILHGTTKPTEYEETPDA